MHTTRQFAIHSVKISIPKLENTATVKNQGKKTKGNIEHSARF